MVDLTVVIPALNEERGMVSIVKEVQSALKGMKYELIVVNDGSTDKTPKLAKDAGAKVLSHQTNLGYGAALKTGFAAAKGKCIAFLDADGTYPPNEIPKLYKHLLETRADVVIGSRLTTKGNKMPFQRKLGNTLLAKMASFLTGARITDTASGLRVFKRELLERIYPLSDDLDLTPQMTMKMVGLGMKLEEVPIKYHERLGQSKLSAVTHGYKFLMTILRMIRDYKPMGIFMSFGFFFMFLGSIAGLYILYRRLVEGELTLHITNGAVLASFTLLLGVQLMFFGFLADMIAGLRRTSS